MWCLCCSGEAELWKVNNVEWENWNPCCKVPCVIHYCIRLNYTIYIINVNVYIYTSSWLSSFNGMLVWYIDSQWMNANLNVMGIWLVILVNPFIWRRGKIYWICGWKVTMLESLWWVKWVTLRNIFFHWFRRTKVKLYPLPPFFYFRVCVCVRTR